MAVIPGQPLYGTKQSPLTSESTQTALAVAGMTPGITGMGADLLSAALYAREGDWKETMWSLASFIPILGMAAGARRIQKGAKGVRAIAKIKKIQPIIEQMQNSSRSRKGILEYKRIKTGIKNFISGPGKKNRTQFINRQIDAGIPRSKIQKNLDKLDNKFYDKLEEELKTQASRDRLGLGNNKLPEIHLDKHLNPKKYEKFQETVRQTTGEQDIISERAREKQLDAIQKLFQEGRAGFTEGGARIRK